MNLIFAVIFTVSVGVMLLTNPNAALAAMSSGAGKAVTLSITLIAVYAIWSGVTETAEKAGLTAKFSKALSPIIDLLFKKQPEEIKKQLSLCVAGNLFGIGGVATPAGIKAAKLLGERRDFFGTDVLFVLSATSIQLLPTTVITLRQEFGSVSPSDIFLPTLLSTLVSTLSGLLLLKIFGKSKKV